MNIEKAIDILDIHNKWRRDHEGKYEMTNQKKLGEAIDTVVSEFKDLQLSDVIPLLERIAHCLDDYVENLDPDDSTDDLSDAVEFMRDVFDDNSLFVRN